MYKYCIALLCLFAACKSPTASTPQTGQTISFAKNGAPLQIDSIKYETQYDSQVRDSVYTQAVFVHDGSGKYVIGIAFFGKPFVGSDTNALVSWNVPIVNGYYQQKGGTFTVQSVSPLHFTFDVTMQNVNIELTGQE